MSKRSCYIHLGTQKTGTTSLQKQLRLNRRLLKTNGYVILAGATDFQEFNRLRHRIRIKNPLSTEEDQLSKLAVKDFNKLPDRSTKETADVTAQRAYQDGLDKNFILSNESFFDFSLSRFKDHLDFVNLLIEPIIDTHAIHIIIYFREQVSFLSSLKKNFPYNVLPLKKYIAAIRPFTKLPPEKEMIIDWEKHYEVLKTSVPTADIRLRSYERIKMEGGLVKDFHSYTGIDTFKLKKFSFDHNKGINPTGLRVLEKCGDLDYRSIGTIKNYLVNTQDRDFARESLVTTKEIDSIQGFYKDKNCRLFGFSETEYDQFLKISGGDDDQNHATKKAADKFLIEELLDHINGQKLIGGQP